MCHSCLKLGIKQFNIVLRLDFLIKDGAQPATQQAYWHPSSSLLLFYILFILSIIYDNL